MKVTVEIELEDNIWAEEFETCDNELVLDDLFDTWKKDGVENVKFIEIKK